MSETTTHTSTAVIRGVWCEANTQHCADEYGDYTIVEIDAYNGLPYCQVEVEGHMTFAGLIAILAELSRGKCPAGARIDWVDSYGRVA